MAREDFQITMQYVSGERCNRVTVTYRGRSAAFDSEPLAHCRTIERRIERMKEILVMLDREGVAAPAGGQPPPPWSPPWMPPA